MLVLKPDCENCGKELPPEATDACICSFECTFCRSCVEEVLENICPNCGGGFAPRPIRPKELVVKYPAQVKSTLKKLDREKYGVLKEKYGHIPPEKR